VPAASEWASYATGFPSGEFFDDVIIAFENRGHYGNVIYVDNINVFIQFSVDEQLSASPTLVVFPNPANDVVRISANNVKQGNYRLQLFDMAGKLVHESGVLSVGSRLEKQWMLPDVANGMYIVALAGDTGRVQQSISIQR
jgi:hypothetical protein